MNGSGQKTWMSSLWYWRLAIFECLTDAFIAGAMVFISAVANQDWDQLTHTAKVTIELCTIVAMLKVVKSFLSTTITVLQDAMPLPPGTTVHQEINTKIDSPTSTGVDSPQAVQTNKTDTTKP